MPASQVTTPEQAAAFTAERGFIYFWPIKGIHFPSLWVAVRGNRPVADAHDDPGHITWGWKDERLGGKDWYYAKVLRGKATLIAHHTTPYFYALTDNYGEPEQDYLQLYAEGRMSREAKVVYETLLAQGPLNTVRLRREARLSGKKSKSPFDRALVTLQRNFLILPVGVAEAGAWRYSHVYDCVHRIYPELLQQARHIGIRQARDHLMSLFFEAMGAATGAAARLLFQWRPGDIAASIDRLRAAGKLTQGEVEGIESRQLIWHALLHG